MGRNRSVAANAALGLSNALEEPVTRIDYSSRAPPAPLLVPDPSALVAQDGLSDDVARILTEQEEDRIYHVLRFADATDRRGP